MITLNNVELVYEGSVGEKEAALSQVNYEVTEGSRVALLGSSGSGKSSLLNIMSNLVEPTKGILLWRGAPLDTKDQIRDFRHNVSYLFQFSDNQFLESRVFDEVAYTLRSLDCDENEVTRRVTSVLNKVGLPCKLFGERNIFTLSGGERRLVALASCLVLEPRLLLLDEPTQGLDGAATERFWSIVTELEGVATVVASHDQGRVLSWCNEVLLLENHTIRMQGTPEEFRSLLLKGEVVPSAYEHESYFEYKVGQQEGRWSLEPIWANPEATALWFLNSLDS